MNAAKKTFAGMALLLCLCRIAPGAAQGGTRDIFEYGTYARALAMGNAFTAMSTGVSALHWNPAALDQIDRPALETTVAILSLGGLYAQMGFAAPTRSGGSLGVGLYTLFGDQIAGYSGDFVPGASFTYLKLKAIAGYGKTLGKLPIQLGFSVKVDYMNLAEAQAFYPNLDFGLMVSVFDFAGVSAGLREKNRLSIGLTGKNLLAFSGPKLGVETDVEPPLFTLGAAYSRLFSARVTARAAMDIAVDLDATPAFSLGAEADFFKNYSVRLGWQLNRGLSTGAGIRIKDLEVAYALLFSPGAMNHNLSLVWQFGTSRLGLLRMAQERERQAIESAVGKAVEEEAQRTAKAREELRKSAEEQVRLSQESADRRVKELVASNESLLRETTLSNRLLVESITASNQAALEAAALANQTLVDAITASNRVLLESVTSSNRQEVESLAASNKARLALIAASNQSLVQNLQRSNQEALQAVNNRTQANLQAMSRQVEEARQKAKTVETSYNSALTAYNAGNLEEALAQFKKVLAVDPQNADVQNLVRLIEESRKPLEKYGKEELDLYREGMKFFLQKNYAKAIETWEALLKKYPYNNLAIQGIDRAKKRLKGN